MNKRITESRPQLPIIKIQTPCDANWNGMDGDATSRFCDHCQMSVHNLSQLDSDSLKTLAECGEKVCVRILRNPDGSVVTKDNNDYDRRRWLRKFGLTAAGLISLLTFGGCEKIQRIVGWNQPLPPDEIAGNVEVEPYVVMGQMIATTPNPATQEPIRLGETTWKSLSPDHIFELEDTQQFQLVSADDNQIPFGFGQFINFKNDGRFIAYNSTMCGNDVNIVTKGTYDLIPGNQISVHVQSIDRNEYCTKKSETPNRDFGVYQLKIVDKVLQIKKVIQP